MGISLYGLTPATTYDALIKTGDNEPLTASLKVLSDGVGTNLPMEASTTGINFTGSLLQGGIAVPTAAQVAAKQDTLVSGTNIKTINGTSVLGSGNIVTPQPSGVAGAIQFSNGSAFASDATNFFWDNTNKRLGVGTNTPSATAHFKGSGSTSATTSLLVQNSAGTAAVNVVDDLSGAVYARTQFCMGYDATPNNNGAFRVLVSSNAKCYLDGFSEGGSKATNYPIIIGARVNNTGTSVAGSTTQENGTQVFFGSDIVAASAQMGVNSTTRGFLPPRMTTTQINAIASPANGLEVYNTTLACPCFYDGTAWRKVSHTTM